MPITPTDNFAGDPDIVFSQKRPDFIRP